jgi:hypothetical protein
MQHNKHGDPSMKKLYATIVTLSLILGAAGAFAQDIGPGAVAVESTETVMKVQTVNYQARSVTLETPEGDVVTLKVPPESQNLEQVYAGARVRASYVQSMAVFVGLEGAEPSAMSASTMQLAPKGETPGVVIVEVKQLQARVDTIDYDERIVVLTGPQGDRVRLKVDERIEHLNDVHPGDTVVVRYTEALGLRMIVDPPAAGRPDAEREG